MRKAGWALLLALAFGAGVWAQDGYQRLTVRAPNAEDAGGALTVDLSTGCAHLWYRGSNQLWEAIDLPTKECLTWVEVSGFEIE